MISNEKEFLFVPITDELRIDAYAFAKESGTYKKSLTNGERMEHSLICEKVVKDYLDAVRENTYDYDLKYWDMRIDVKCNSVMTPPKVSTHYCIISGDNMTQACDLYVFCAITTDLSKVWIIGWIRKEIFMKDSLSFESGFKFDTMPNPTKFKGRFVKAETINPISLIKI